MLSDVFGEYKPSFGLIGYISTVDECNYVERNISIDGTGETESVKYLQEDRLFFLRDYDKFTEEVEVNIVISLAIKKALDLEIMTKGDYVSMSMNLNKWHSYLSGDFNTILKLENGDAAKSNSIILQVFKFGKNKKALWEELNSSNKTTLDKLIEKQELPCTNLDDCKEYLADDFGLIKLNVPRKECSVVEVESLETLSRFWFRLFILSPRVRLRYGPYHMVPRINMKTKIKYIIDQ